MGPKRQWHKPAQEMAINAVNLSLFLLEQLMTLGWTRKASHWIAIWILALTSQAAWAESIAWTEDAKLQDGRAVTVQIEGNSTTLPYYLSYQKSNVNQFKLAFRHPDTQQTIVWQGARYFSPVLLDVVDGVPYLVVYGRPTQDTRDTYGCPELPYVFLRHGADGWHPVTVEQAPATLRTANLAAHDVPSDAAGRHFSVDEVSQRVTDTEHQTAGLLQKAIPRAIAHWHAKNRRGALNDRLVGDCRPPRALLSPLVLPAPTAVAPELLESVDFVPETAYGLDDWRQRSTDTRRADACKPMFLSKELDPYNLDLRFTHDKTGTKRVPYARQGAWEPGLTLLCDANLWFITTQQDPQKLTITQTTHSGDSVFRVAFSGPAHEADLVGTLLWPTLHSDSAYLYFEWALGRAEGSQWLVKRILKMRVPLK
jgi:hypothetical protein